MSTETIRLNVEKALEEIRPFLNSDGGDITLISIEDDSYVNSLFKCISKFDNIVKFSVEDPSLNEIFISIVGDSYDK